MKRSKFAIVIYFLIALAAFGLVSQLIRDPVNFITGILIMLLIAAVLFAFVYFVFFKNRSGSTDENKKYKQAVKQSQMKYQQKDSLKKIQPSKITQKKKAFGKGRNRKRRASHLRIIEGSKNKEKEKDRATF